MDQIVNDESKEDGGVETHEQLLDDIEKEFGESKSIASENRSKKSASRPGTSAKERKDDEVKSVKSRKLFEEEKVIMVSYFQVECLICLLLKKNHHILKFIMLICTYLISLFWI